MDRIKEWKRRERRKRKRKNRITKRNDLSSLEGRERREKIIGVDCLQHPGGVVSWVVRRSIFVRFDAERRGRADRLPPYSSGESPKTPRAPGVLIGQCVTGNCRYSCAAFSGLPAVALGTTCMDGAYSCTQGPWSTSCFSRCDASPHFRR